MAHVQNNKVFIIKNVKGGTVLDLSKGDNVTVTGYPLNNGPNQKWMLTRVENGWTIRSLQGNYLAIQGNPKDNGVVHGRSDPYVWHINQYNNNAHQLLVTAPDTPFSLDLSGYGNAADGAPIKVWGRNTKNDNQLWDFIEVSQ